jgi:hypothetical protein
MNKLLFFRLLPLLLMMLGVVGCNNEEAPSVKDPPVEDPPFEDPPVGNVSSLLAGTPSRIYLQKIKRLIIMKKYILLFVILISCSDKRDEKNFSTDVFEIHGSVFLAEDVLQDPCCLLLIDSVLIVANNNGEPFIETYDLHGNALQKFLTAGQGPEEILTVGNLQNVNHGLYVYDLFDRKFLNYDYQELKNANVVKPESVHRYSFVVRDSSLIIRMLLMGSDYLLGEQLSDSRIALFDFEGHIISQGGAYPPATVPNLSDYENAGLYSSSIVLDNSRKKVALATYLADMIDIFDISGNTVETVWSFRGFLPHDYMVVQMGEMNRAAFTNNSQSGYADIASSDNYIYASFSGRTRARNKENYSYCNIIRVAGWDGKKRFELHTEVDIKKLTVSEDDRSIYAIAIDENDDPMIVYYDISEITRGIK